MVEYEKLSGNLAKELGVALKARDMMLVLAESCTGGMAAEAVTSIAGSSAWFDRGFVTYSNASKVEMLGVSTATLEKFGAVSEDVAKEMALGCLKSTALNNSHAHIAASITGIAGPDGGSLEKPVGTVCFAWASINNTVTTSTKYFDGNREEIRQKATIFCLAELIQRLALIKN
jgi:nicotinamide-nucleotide amidase